MNQLPFEKSATFDSVFADGSSCLFNFPEDRKNQNSYRF